MTHEAGKGDKQRPTNWDHFSENFDRIFGGGKHYKEGSLEKYVLDEKIAEYEEAVVEAMLEEDIEDEICSWCSGSGEGMYDGATCNKCHGSGVEPVEKEDDY